MKKRATKRPTAQSKQDAWLLSQEQWLRENSRMLEHANERNRRLGFVSNEMMLVAAEHAEKCTALIREWMPIAGQSSSVNERLIDDAFRVIAGHCIEFLRFNPNDGAYSYSASKEIGLAWKDLCSAMHALHQHYQIDVRVGADTWRLPSIARDGKQYPAIEMPLVERIERRAAIVLSESDDDPWVKVRACWVKCRTTLHRDADDSSKPYVRHIKVERRYEIKRSELRRYMTQKDISEHIGE
jgi:hypothetical protein